MKHFLFKSYLSNSSEIIEYGYPDQPASMKKTGRPFPDSLLSLLYFDTSAWDARFQEADRALLKFYETRDAVHLKTVQQLVDDFGAEHPYFEYLRLEWTERLSQAAKPDCDSVLDTVPHKQLRHVPSTLDSMQRQILYLFRTVLDADAAPETGASRLRAYAEAASLHRFAFRPLNIDFELLDGGFTEVLYPQSMYDLIEFALRICIREKLPMRVCKNCGKYFALTAHGNTEYCGRVFDEKGRTCKDVGAMRQYAQTHADDELFKLYRREYKRRFAWIRAGKIAPEAFSDWSETARRMKAKCDAGELAEEDFLRWLGR